jgi:hypothetical protein
MITYTFTTTKLLKDASDYIRVVEWQIEFSDGTTTSTAGGKTVIPEGVNITVDGNIQEATFNAMGGEESFIANLQPIHEEMLSLSSLESTLTEVTEN